MAVLSHRWLCFFSVLGMAMLTGCLTIEEHYTFKKNGSGTMEYIVDLSVMGEMLDGLAALGEESSSETESDFGGLDLAGNVDRLKDLPGISKVAMNTKKEFIRKISFHFKDLNALNSALNVLLPDSITPNHEFFRWEGKTLVRTNNLHAMELGRDMADDDPEENERTAEFLKSMHYRYSFTFASPIADKKTADGVVVTADSGKKLDLDTDWSVIMTDPKALDLRITLK